MKKLITLLIAAIFPVGIAVAGQPDQNQDELPTPFMKPWYFGGEFGVSVPSGSGSSAVNTGFDLDGHVGYRLNRYFRVDGAFTYYRNGIPGGSAFNLTTLFANGYVQYPINYGLAPFLGMGIGWGHVYSGAGAFVPSSNQFAYQFVLGLSYYFNINMAVQTSYHLVSWTGGGGLLNVVNVGFNYFFH